MEEIDYYALMLELAEAEFMPAIFEIAEPAVNDEEEYPAWRGYVAEPERHRSE